MVMGYNKRNEAHLQLITAVSVLFLVQNYS